MFRSDGHSPEASSRWHKRFISFSWLLLCFKEGSLLRSNCSLYIRTTENWSNWPTSGKSGAARSLLTLGHTWTLSRPIAFVCWLVTGVSLSDTECSRVIVWFLPIFPLWFYLNPELWTTPGTESTDTRSREEYFGPISRSQQQKKGKKSGCGCLFLDLMSFKKCFAVFSVACFKRYSPLTQMALQTPVTWALTRWSPHSTVFSVSLVSSLQSWPITLRFKFMYM